MRDDPTTGFHVLIDNTADIRSVRRNLLLSVGLSAILYFAKADTKDFRLLGASLSTEALYGCLFFGILFLLIQFILKAILVLSTFYVDREKRRPLKVKGKIEGDLLAASLILTFAFDFLIPVAFSIVMLGLLLFSFSIQALLP